MSTSSDYMSSPADCSRRPQSVGGAVVYSHKARDSADHYPHNVDCPFYFQAARSDWKLMLRVLEIDIPDRTQKGLCKDALYIYDANTYVTRAMVSILALQSAMTSSIRKNEIHTPILSHPITYGIGKSNGPDPSLPSEDHVIVP